MAARQKLIGFAAFSLLAMGVTLYANRELESQPFHIKALPEAYNSWSSRDAPITDMVNQILVSDQVFGRFYYGPKDPFFLSIVYYPNGKLNFHHPEGCTRSKGSVLSNRRPIRFEGAWPETQGTYFQIMEPSGRTTHYAYAFCTPYQAHGDYIDFRKHLALSSLGKGRTACALIRLSMVDRGERKDVEKRMQAIWKEFSFFFLAGFQAPNQP